MTEEAKLSDSIPDRKDAEALAAALNHSAERAQTLWFSFLTFMVYLAIATGTTTHRMLYLETPLNLPVLNIGLQLLGFYVLTPIIFVVVHFYMLLNLVLLARTAKSFDGVLLRAFPEDGEARESFRMRIENTLFVQLLVGGRLEREGINAKLLSLMALITLAVAPVALLLMIQIKFLPYHSEWITWLHRGLLATGLALVWTLWPGYRSGWGVRLWPKLSWALAWPCVLSVAVLSYAFLIVTFPDECMYLATSRLHGSSYWQYDELKFRDRLSWYNWIAPTNTLDLHGEVLVENAKLRTVSEENGGRADDGKPEAVDHRPNRDLTEANFANADVRRVDFSNSILNRANLNHAKGEKAQFDLAELKGAELQGTYLKGSFFRRAQLDGALLDGALLQGTDLVEAHLLGASLDNAQLQGAVLQNAGLWAASLKNAHLQGADLKGTRLQIAFLDNAQLLGASLENANLLGASLDNVELQGALLKGAHLKAASFKNVFVWRADAREEYRWKAKPTQWPPQANFENDSVEKVDKDPEANLAYPRVANPIIDPKYRCDKGICDWTAESFAELKLLISDQVPQGQYQLAAIKRIERSLNPNEPLNGQDDIASVWVKHEGVSPAPDDFKKNLDSEMRDIGCAALGAPYVIRSLINHLLGTRSLFTGRQGSPYSGLAAAFLDENCAGARGLSEDEIKRIREIANLR
jgi:uncharacterized protein YjbI with pentapeptide repeats